MLLVGDRVVLRASGPPEAEYALFDPGDIELRASEPGRVREHGYRTTVARARSRLSQGGVTESLARRCAAVMNPVLAEAFARGPAVERVARHLGPAELFQSDTYEAATQMYQGAFIDLEVLSRDLDIRGASAMFQALHLAALLEQELGDDSVVLSTDAWTKQRRPGERTHKRPTFPNLDLFEQGLRQLAASDPKPEVGEPLPRADVIAFLRERTDSARDETMRDLYASLERTVTARERPARGPLASPELWDLEVRIDAGDLEDLMYALDAVEQKAGRTPGSTYVRARASLVLGLEPPAVIASRTSALALSLTSFHELSLLTAEAWLQAGEPRRAMPFARDLAETHQLDEGLLLRAQRLLARAVGAAPDEPEARSDIPPARSLPREARQSNARETGPAYRRSVTQLGLGVGSEAPAAFDISPAEKETTDRDIPVVEEPEQASRRSPSHAHTMSIAFEARAQLSYDPRSEPEGERQRLPASRPALPPPRTPWHLQESSSDRSDASIPNLEYPWLAGSSARPPFDTPLVDTNFELDRGTYQTPDRSAASDPMAGGSHPPYRVERPLSFASRPSAPQNASSDVSVEHWSLPGETPPDFDAAGASAETPAEVRAHFTILARGLGLDYRVNRGIELRADISGIEAMQAVLRELFPRESVDTEEERYEVRRHGAFLSELLARRLDAEWVDVSPADVGHWAMVVPPDMRIWPFGRLLRFIHMAHRERDLVSYYFELRDRTRKR